MIFKSLCALKTDCLYYSAQVIFSPNIVYAYVSNRDTSINNPFEWRYASHSDL